MRNKDHCIGVFFCKKNWNKMVIAKSSAVYIYVNYTRMFTERNCSMSVWTLDLKVIEFSVLSQSALDKYDTSAWSLSKELLSSRYFIGGCMFVWRISHSPILRSLLVLSIIRYIFWHYVWFDCNQLICKPAHCCSVVCLYGGPWDILLHIASLFELKFITNYTLQVSLVAYAFLH